MAKKTKNSADAIHQDVKESAHKIWLAGLGALSMAEDEGSKLFKNLVTKGEGWESKGREAVTDVKGDVEEVVDRAKGRAENIWDKIEDRLDEAVGGALKRLGVPARDEIATLTRRVEELTNLVEQMKTPAKKTPAKKAPVRRATKAAAPKATAKKKATTAKKPAAAKPAAAKPAAAKPAADDGQGEN